MALRKTITWRGLDLNFWVITARSWNIVNNLTTVNISPYANLAAKQESDANFMPELTKTFYIEGEPTKAEIYQFIKQDPWFTDSEEV